MTALSGITLKQLRSVKAVVQTGSITQAASLLGLTPPAVHTQLRGLEAQNSIEACLKSCLNQIEAMKKA